MIQDALAERRPHGWQKLSLILKIERTQAVHNLTDIVVNAARRQPTGIMIARCDFSVEIGFAERPRCRSRSSGSARQPMFQ